MMIWGNRGRENNMLEKGMLATLTDGKSYIVMLIVELDNIKYILLIENKNFENIKFCIESIENDRIKLIEVEDLSLRQRLLMEFTNKFQHDIVE